MTTFIVTTSLDLPRQRKDAAIMFYLVEAKTDKDAIKTLDDFGDLMNWKEKVLEAQVLHWMGSVETQVAWIGQITKYPPWNDDEEIE